MISLSNKEKKFIVKFIIFASLEFRLSNAFVYYRSFIFCRHFLPAFVLIHKTFVEFEIACFFLKQKINIHAEKKYKFHWTISILDVKRKNSFKNI